MKEKEPIEMIKEITEDSKKRILEIKEIDPELFEKITIEWER